MTVKKHNMDVLNESFANEMDNRTTLREVAKAFPVLKVAILSTWTVLLLAPNCIVLAVFIAKPDLRNKHRTEFILWLCVCDIIIGLISLMYSMTQSIIPLATSPKLCGFLYHCVYAGELQSLVTTFLLCWERYLAVFRKIEFRLLEKKTKYFLVIGSWVIINIYVGIMAVCYLQVDNIEFCGIEAFPNRLPFMTGTACVGTLALFSTVCIYILFIIKFRSQMRIVCVPSIELVDKLYTLHQNNGKASPNLKKASQHTPVSSSVSPHATLHASRKEREVIITIGLIVVALLFLTGPFVVTKALEGLSVIKLSRTAKTSITYLAASNSIFNPILYAWRLPAFRKEIRNIFTKTPRT